MKKLKAPIGSEGANIGTTLFKLDADGNVTVPDDAAQTLVGVGGFEIICDVPDAPNGQTVLRSAIGPQSCSFGDQSFSTDENGFITVPTVMAEQLLSHGFVIPASVVGAPVEPAAPDVIDIPAVPLGEKPADIPVAPIQTAE